MRVTDGRKDCRTEEQIRHLAVIFRKKCSSYDFVVFFLVRQGVKYVRTHVNALNTIRCTASRPTKCSIPNICQRLRNLAQTVLISIKRHSDTIYAPSTRKADSSTGKIESISAAALTTFESDLILTIRSPKFLDGQHEFHLAIGQLAAHIEQSRKRRRGFHACKRTSTRRLSFCFIDGMERIIVNC